MVLVTWCSVRVVDFAIRAPVSRKGAQKKTGSCSGGRGESFAAEAEIPNKTGKEGDMCQRKRTNRFAIVSKGCLLA